MTYPNLSDEEIQKLRDVISNTLSNMKKDMNFIVVLCTQM